MEFIVSVRARDSCEEELLLCCPGDCRHRFKPRIQQLLWFIGLLKTPMEIVALCFKPVNFHVHQGRNLRLAIHSDIFVPKPVVRAKVRNVV